MDNEKIKLIAENLAVFCEIIEERKDQDAAWGEQNHNPIEWLAILMEEVGEASQAAVDGYFKPDAREANYEIYREEIVQVAAVAINMIQSFDRNERKSFISQEEPEAGGEQ